MDGGYGIYAGAKRAWATLLFKPQAAQWVSREEWHPDQQVSWLPDGRYQLKVPFNDETELIMDLLRQGEFVEVVAPLEFLRSATRAPEGCVKSVRG
ncbi:MAG: WYL domain-containing protein [Betaproteobacteria bacterium]|nr:WYL domain-containing protein [Betaproteobacteria bacterium]